MGAIDRMDWHYGGDFPEDLSEENAGTHIGMYLTWIIDNDLIGDLHRQDSQESIQKVLNREMTGRDFLIEECDEKFWEEDLSEEGIAFTEFYYSGESNETFSNYFDDYAEVLASDVESIYEVENTWENYNKLKPTINRKYKEWKLNI